MTYHRRQRLESFKRAMFAELLRDDASNDELTGQTDTIKQDHEPWGLLPPQLSGVGTGRLLS
jgi:hypothetical protein